MPQHTINSQSEFTINNTGHVNVVLGFPHNHPAHVKVSFNNGSAPLVFVLDRYNDNRSIDNIPATVKLITIRNSGPNEINIGW